MLPDNGLAVQKYVLTTEPSTRLCVEVAGPRANTVVIWMADPLALQGKECWDRQFAGRLAESLSLVRYDLRGTGCSSKPEHAAAYSLAAQAVDLQDIVRTFGGARVMIVAAGWAGAILAEFLRRFDSEKARLLGLVLMGASPHLNRFWRSLAYSGLESRSYWLTGQNEGVRRAAIEEYLRYGYTPAPPPEERWPRMVGAALDISPAAVRALVDAYRVSTQIDAPPEQTGPPVPVLFCHGEEDRLVSMKCANIGASQFPHSRVISYRRLGHGLAEAERPAQDIEAFLLSVAGVSA